MRIFLTVVVVFLLGLSGYIPVLSAQGKLEVMVVPPAPSLNWDNPTILTLSYLRSYAQKTLAKKLYGRERFAMGHGIVRVQCSTGEEEVDFWSGYTGNDNNRGLHLFYGGAGLSIMTYKYQDGHLQSTEFVNKFLHDITLQPEIKASFIRMNVNQEQCKMIKDHYDEFRKNGTENLVYGFFTDPLRYAGAGCTSYATSFAQKSGVFPDFLEKNWTRTIEISTKNLGPTDQAFSINGHNLKPISYIKFINLLRPLQWKRKNEHVISFSFIDPRFMEDFFMQSIECLENPDKCKSRPDLMDWLRENEAKVCHNEYFKGIEINLK